jgi:hypothetical protein
MAGKMLEKELKEDLMVYDTGREKLHILNDTARLIMRLHRQGKTVNEIEAAIKQGFRFNDGDDIRSDVLYCVQLLKEEGIIQTGA